MSRALLFPVSHHHAVRHAYSLPCKCIPLAASLRTGGHTYPRRVNVHYEIQVAVAIAVHP